MPTFNLSEDTIARLKKKFTDFQNARKHIHELLTNYAADYRQFNGTAYDRKEFLEKKYSPKVPDLSHLIADEGQIYWHVSDIAILLGRTQQAISYTLLNLERSEGWCSRLLSIRKQSKSVNGNKIFVYSEDVFDLLIDRYEEEYLQRFSNPRRGSQDNAPDIHEVRKFWKYLHDMEENNYLLALRQQKITLPDIPPMTWKDIFALIWNKIFNIRVGTICSVVFAVCFELTRHFFGINIWLAVIPALISIICLMLIHKRKFSPDTLSDIGACALLFTMLWISASCSLPNNDEIKAATQNIILTPIRAGDHKINFNIIHNISDVKEFLYCIKPDILFHSTGFLNQFNPDNNLPYPALSIPNSQTEGIAYIDLKFIDNDNKESAIHHFSFDISQERFKLNKNFILNINNSWVSASKYKIFTNNEIITEVALSPFIFADEIKSSIQHLFYGINDGTPGVEVDFDNLNTYEPYLLLRTNEDYIKFVSSQIIFTDGSSSDIRINKIR